MNVLNRVVVDWNRIKQTLMDTKVQKIERKHRLVTLAEGLKETRMKEDWVWLILAFAVGIYVMGQPW